MMALCVKRILSEAFTLKQSDVASFFSSTITILLGLFPEHLEAGSAIGRRLSYFINVERFVTLHPKTQSLVRLISAFFIYWLLMSIVK